MSNVFTIIKLGFIACILAAFAFALVVNNPAFVDALEAVQSAPPVTPMNAQHVSKHTEAMTVAQCSNVDSIWIDNQCVRFKYVKDVDGNCALEVVEPTKLGLKLVTAFYFDRGTRADLENILKAQGCTKIYP